MGNLTIKEIEERGLLAYKYIRGSWAHGLGVEGKSDIDIGGVYFAPYDVLIGLPEDYQPQVTDEKGDTIYYEFGRWVELLLKGNIQAIESLFIDDEFIQKKPHFALLPFFENRESFLTKKFLSQSYKFALSQIKKARGLNKKINNPITERKDILDFCYTFRGQGSQTIKTFLKECHLDQKYCGIVNIPNMKDIYGVYYDFASYFYFENIEWYVQEKGRKCITYPFNRFINNYYSEDKILENIANKDFYGYEGIINPDDYQKSNDIRLSSVHKGDKPICYLYFNKDGYITHCKDYKEYKEWEKNRNPERYESNLKQNFDGKNMCECTRLLNTALDVVNGKGYILKRTEDRDFLLSIKNHEMTYNEIISYLESFEKTLETTLQDKTLPDDIDREQVKVWMLSARQEYYFTN